jgi:DNA-binding response OmpR family regulator
MQQKNIIGSIQPNTTQIPRKKHKIVIADDDLAILDAMKLMLELYNFEVETVADGMVISKLLSMQPKLLLLDVYMSGVDGRDICRAIKATAATKNIPVIMISASSNMKDALKDSGADDYLPKPFDIEELLSKVNKYLLN